MIAAASYVVFQHQSGRYPNTGEAVELTRELGEKIGLMEDDTISEAEAKAARYDPSD